MSQPASTYSAGDVARATLAVADPRGPLRDNYFTVERKSGDDWHVMADDAGWDTTIEWHATAGGEWTATMTWRVPALSGTFRFSYVDARGAASTSEFAVH